MAIYSLPPTRLNILDTAGGYTSNARRVVAIKYLWETCVIITRWWRSVAALLVGQACYPSWPVPAGQFSDGKWWDLPKRDRVSSCSQLLHRLGSTPEAASWSST
ncbi:uncharacterized protein BCR38DRAFT_29280 [Pseudomassariella vexata]|uniref:Uncharacterized protein n=1 Tax=Pseudomassariella vexata TaxID=1141098 RepID=A0A1Y2DPJ3_9PEZI|nr:uncharacterized protein BCR38DRAFT_29280 [Pseudomassariella vexata]ORY61203.1 hypothetical protein BCR38DRAFT_29280 [Pseudomassariella vexata]